jgi:hypothetical protein
LKRDIIEFIGNARRPKGERFRHQLYIFLVCLGISIFIWLLVRLSKDYIYTVSYQLNYNYIPDNLKLTGISDSIITLNIKVQGFDFFSEEYFRSKKRYLDINLRDARLHFTDNRQAGYIIATSISRQIATQTNFPLEIYSISPDTLYFTFEKKNIKRLPSIKINSIPPPRIIRKDDSLRLHLDSVANKQLKPEISRNKKGK